MQPRSVSTSRARGGVPGCGCPPGDRPRAAPGVHGVPRRRRPCIRRRQAHFPVSWGWSAPLPLLAVGAGSALRLSGSRSRWQACSTAFASGALAELVRLGPRSRCSGPGSVTASFASAVQVIRSRVSCWSMGRRGVTSLVVALWAALVVGCDLRPLVVAVPRAALLKFQSVSEYRLSSPLGYSNGLGMLAVIGALLRTGPRLPPRPPPGLPRQRRQPLLLPAHARLHVQPGGAGSPSSSASTVAFAVDRRPAAADHDGDRARTLVDLGDRRRLDVSALDARDRCARGSQQ